MRATIADISKLQQDYFFNRPELLAEGLMFADEGHRARHSQGSQAERNRPAQAHRDRDKSRERVYGTTENKMNTEKLTADTARKAVEQIKAALGGMPSGHKVRPGHAYASGKENRRLGMGRVSPYYEAPYSDHFWFAGYDGKTMQEAIESQ